MKTVSPAELNQAYMQLHPGEIRPDAVSIADSERVLANWLERYANEPAKAISLTNWQGKVTLALLKALKLPTPKTKTQAMALLA
jgi:hypothetical protein